MEGDVVTRGLYDVDRLRWIYTYAMEREYWDGQRRAGK
jgi:hypothetical protein